MVPSSSTFARVLLTCWLVHALVEHVRFVCMFGPYACVVGLHVWVCICMKEFPNRRSEVSYWLSL